MIAIGARAAQRSMVIAQCLGLAVACAKGEQLDHGPVAPIVLADASVAEVGAGGEMGSGGATGSGGVTESGGALQSGGAKASGGTPGKGGSAGSGTGEVSGSGGKVASGGMPGSGGAASGGAPASGGSSGSGSGGRASGGASGGSAGSGMGGGSGGAQNCPGYVDDDACSKCICQKCKSQVDACFNSSDTMKNQQCKAIQDCAEQKHCAGGPCYCTQPPTDPFCLNPDGVCKDPIIAAAGGGANALTIQNLGNDSNHPIGRANNIGKCTISNCKTECQIP